MTRCEHCDRYLSDTDTNPEVLLLRLADARADMRTWRRGVRLSLGALGAVLAGLVAAIAVEAVGFIWLCAVGVVALTVLSIIWQVLGRDRTNGYGYIERLRFLERRWAALARIDPELPTTTTTKDGSGRLPEKDRNELPDEERESSGS